MARIMLSMDILTRPKRKRRAIVEPHDSYTFYLPVATMERFRAAAEADGRSYSDAMIEAVNIYLAANIQRQHKHHPPAAD